jgi:NAD(P)H-hydrate epimerase
MGTHFTILCGSGNNGGDGLAAARHLGRAARVHLLAEPDPQSSPDAALQLRILRKLGLPVAVGVLPATLDKAVVLIDALFGTGLSRPLTGTAAAWVGWFNAAPGNKLAVDIPSGLDGDTGEVLGLACAVDRTVTFLAPKHGMLRGQGPRSCGAITVAGLGCDLDLDLDPEPA